MDEALITLAVVLIVAGVLIGGALFEGIPWLYHHLSIHWS